MLRLRNDLLPVLAAAAAGDFGDERLEFDDGAAACVVLANAGYPGKPSVGDAIAGLDEAARQPGAVVFHAGTRRDAAGAVVAASGRVLNVCAHGGTLAEALDRAYAAADRIQWPSRTLRRDIGRRVV
jgi:phosphoribosylamine--glycine ligase